MHRENKKQVNIFDNSTLSQASERIHKRKRRNRIFTILLTTLLVLVALYLIAVMFCRIAIIEIRGTDIYTDSEVIEAIDVKVGDKLLNLDKKDISETIVQKLSGIEQVKVKAVLPNKLVIELYEGSPKFSFESGDKLYYLSENFIALGSELSVTQDDVIYNLQPNQIKKYITGEKVKFYDSDWEKIIINLKTI